MTTETPAVVEHGPIAGAKRKTLPLLGTEVRNVQAVPLGKHGAIEFYAILSEWLESDHNFSVCALLEGTPHADLPTGPLLVRVFNTQGWKTGNFQQRLTKFGLTTPEELLAHFRQGVRNSISNLLEGRADSCQRFTAKLVGLDEEFCAAALVRANARAVEKTKREEDERLKRERAEAANALALNAALQRLRAGERIDAVDLLALAKLKGIEVHPRTIGTIRKRVSMVGTDSLSFSGKHIDFDKIYNLAKQVAAADSEEEPEQPADPEVERLFKGATA